MVYPGNYIVNDENYSSIMLYSFVTLGGDTVLEAGSPDAFLRENEEIMAQYGFYDIYNMPIELYYSFNDRPQRLLSRHPAWMATILRIPIFTIL